MNSKDKKKILQKIISDLKNGIEAIYSDSWFLRSDF